MSEKSPDTKMLCYCRNVNYGRVRECISDIKARRIEQVMEACDAGTGCKSCHPEIETLLAEAAASRKAGGVFEALKRLFGG
ncbi:MAG: (2Fe-2S)-binding protein [Planctomycetota bacterium]